MSKSGALVIIEDDIDDRIFLEKIFKDIGFKNEVIWFSNTDDAFAFLNTTIKIIFIIFSDVSLPGQSGLDFKKQLDGNPKLRQKSIPFIFYSTSANQQEVNEAYTQMTIQGFFKKENNIQDTTEMLKTIFAYWSLCRHPNTQ
ncbi:response regulator [Flavobacterium zepuense]|uniref:Response regulator n=1 Tax=Flavobacterium zepuense TaxID=2593302 RepID=A0A552V9S5_9FLAO|nr:response regulator [Flavobacterium zepuense]TRW27189.1 response regulator [Flavobacterium zepuense]